MSLIAELKRRSVFKVGAAYLVIAWLVIQVAATVAPQMGLPDWAPRLVTLLLMVGFPVALVLAWVFDVAPDGHLKVESSGRGGLAVYGIAGALVAASLYWYWAGQTTAPATGADVRSIAVLPFVNMSGDAENEYFSDGISEEILNQLAKMPELRVAARTSSFSFKGDKREVTDIAQELKVRMVLEGSVRKQGEKVRITAQLIDAQEGFHLWSETYDRDLKDIFVIQDEIARAIAKELKVKIAGPDAAGADAAGATNATGTTDLQAYDLYLQGLAKWQTRRGVELLQAEQLFERAIERDPRFARAWAGLALANIILPNFTDEDPVARGRKALAAASRATQLDPTLAEPLAVFGWHDRRSPDRWLIGLSHLRHAVLLNPSFATGHQWLGQHYLMLGDFERAGAELERAAALDPRSLAVQGAYVSYLNVSGRGAEADAYCAAGMVDALRPVSCEMQPLMRGADDASLAAWLLAYPEKNKPTPPALEFARTLAAALRGTGDRAAAARLIAALPLNSHRDPQAANFLGDMPLVILLIRLGAPELAEDRIIAVWDTRYDVMMNWLWSEVLDPIRCRPRFRAMVATFPVPDPRAAEVCGAAPTPSN